MKTHEDRKGPTLTTDAAKAKEAKRSQVTTNRDMKSFVAMITKAEKDRHKRIREDHNEDDEDMSDSEDGF